jgi:hypothetical protein
MVAMVNVGGTLVPADATFRYGGGFGTEQIISAAQAASIVGRTYDGASTFYGSAGRGFTSYEGYIDPYQPGTTAPPPAPARPAAKPKRKAAPRKSTLTAPPKPNLPAVNDPITPAERAEISKPAKGLESTIKTNPVLLREKRRRSYLTAGAY